MNYRETVRTSIGEELNPIKLYPVPDGEHEYSESNFDNFQYVFTKDNMPTYHQQYNCFQHWIWNEYHNDPDKFESDEYKEKVLAKIFTFINARVFGIVNPDSNHSTIMQILQKVINLSIDTSDIDIMEIIVSHARSLYGRKLPFTEDDALIWYFFQDDNGCDGYQYKPIIVPYIKLDGRTICLYDNAMKDFYEAIFSYANRYYDHMYSSKNNTAWYSIDPNTWLVGKLSVKSPDNSFNHLDEDKLDHRMMSELYLHQAKDFCSEKDVIYPVLLMSTNGRFYDSKMYPVTYAFLIHTDDGMFISSQRGYDSFIVKQREIFKDERRIIDRKWIDTLIPKARNEEAIRAAMWRDVMQCNVVLFPEQTDRNMEIDLMILNWAKYKDVFCINMRISDRIVTVDEEHDIAYVTLHSARTLYDIWNVLEHSLDLWVKYGGENMAWSLISNIYRHPISFYANRPHLIYQFCANIPHDNLDEQYIAISPRDGMSWTFDQEEFTFKPIPINGLVLRKCYL